MPSHLKVRAVIPDDVVEVLLESHAAARSMLSQAETVAAASAGPSTSQVAQRVAAYFTEQLETHFADEETTLGPRLKGRHPVLDEALGAMRFEHLQLRALTSRVGFLCELVAKDPERLMSLRFELSTAVESLSSTLESHQAREESILFPAVRRMLDSNDVIEMHREMALRRAPGVELSEAGA